MINQEAQVSVQVNNRDAVDKIRELETRAEELRKKFTEACRNGDTTGVQRLGEELRRTDRELRTMRTNADNIRAAMSRLDQATPKQLRAIMRQINEELNSGRVQRGTAEWQRYVEQLQRVREELTQCTALTSTTSEAGLFSRIQAWGNRTFGAFSVLTATLSGVALSLSDLKSRLESKESAQAELKALTKLDDDSVKWLTQQAEQMSTTMDETGLRVTQSSEEIIKAFMAVGSNKPELLAAKEDLATVTKEAMRLAQAAGMELDPAVTAMTTALNQFSMGAEDAARVVNVLAAGSQAGASNVRQQAASILNAGTAAVSAGVDFEQLVGSIEMLGEKGIKAEVAGTGLKSVFLAMATGAADTNPKIVGLSTALENLKKQVDAAEAASAGGGAALLQKMFGSGGFDVASVLVENIEGLNKYTEAVTGTQTAIEQAAIASDTAAAKSAQAKNEIIESALALTEELMPAVGAVVKVGATGISGLLQAVKWLLQFKVTLIAVTAALGVYAVAKNKDIILTKSQEFWNDKLTKSIEKAYKAMLKYPYALVAAAVVAVLAVLADLIRKNSELTAGMKAVAAVQADAAAKTAEHETEVRRLISAANDVTLSYDEQKAAVDRLNKLIPDFNGKINATTREFTYSKEALDKYLGSLRKMYELEGAKDTLKELYAEKARLTADMQLNVDKINEVNENKAKRHEGMGSTARFWDNVYLDITGQGSGSYRRQYNKDVAQYNEVQERIDALEKAFGPDLVKDAVNPKSGVNPDPNPDPAPAPGKGKGKTTTPKATAAQETAANDILAAGASERLKLQAEEALQWQEGKQLYSDYIRARRNIDLDYYEAALADMESKGLTETEVYKKTQKEYKAMVDGGMKEMEAARAKDLEDALKTLDEEKKAAVNAATDAFNDPASVMFNNQRALSLALLEADVDYLTKRRDLYVEGSKEWIAADRELTDRQEEDRRQKQQETAEALKNFRLQYTKEGALAEFKVQREIIEKLHAEGLISEKQYQAALRKIRKEETEAGKEDAKEINSEYGDLVTNLYKSFSDLFSSLGEGGEDFWKNLSSAAEACVAVMMAALSSYSNYSNAARDLEIAKIEKRYDAEIKAAKNNTTKVSQLEEEKEAEVAAVKREYNERAMKIEIAQAIASTALAAINAYASASQVNWILGPIAAALAVAAGAVQIAAIKKQHEAQALGYYSGGFTATSADDRKEVGVVHANEFVANHQAVANPALRSIFGAIDQAQRNNTVGRLTPADLVGSAGTAAPLSPAVDMSGVNSTLSRVDDTVNRTAATLATLDRTLSQGVDAFVVLDGERGLYKKFTNYQKTLTRGKR